MPYKSKSELPESVRNALPAHAQDIFMSAFNSAVGDHDEDAAFRIAWDAVKAKYRKEGDTWVRKAEDHRTVAMRDAVSLTGVRRTADGYLAATANVARPGIQLYRGYEVGHADKDVVRVYRPPAEVFDQAALRTFAHRPVTLDHPPEAVTSGNWKQYAIGQTGDEVDGRDGRFVRVPLVLMDAAAIEAVEGGKRELSMGYTADLAFEDGETPDGERYDAVQRTIRANHLAVVSAARGGSSLRIGDDQTKGDQPPMTTKTITVDGVSVEMSDVSAQVVNRALDGASKQLEDASKRVRELEQQLAEAKAEDEKQKAAQAKDAADHKTAIDAKDAEITTLKQQLKDAEITPRKLDELVKDRDTTIGKAKAMIGDKLVVDGKTNADIKRQVVSAKLGDAAKAWTDDQVAVSFATLTADVKVADPVARALADSGRGNGGTVDVRDQAYAEMIKRQQGAWRGNAGTAGNA